MDIFIKILHFLVMVNEKLFSNIDNFISSFDLPHWFIDSLIDCIHMLPFLFITFLIVEIIEYFFSEKIKDISKYSTFSGPLVGALFATFPQCGFSVLAAGLYTKKLITAGTLIAVFISTSDESLPILLANPKNISFVLPVIATKIVIAIIAGYSVDFIFKNYNKHISHNDDDKQNSDIGCCNHNVTGSTIKDVIIHPIVHTVYIFTFILVITIILNYTISADLKMFANNFIMNNEFMQIILMTFIGLIPNCAASVAITLLFLNGSIAFSSTIAGLCSGSGLGILVLFKNNNNLRDSFNIILSIIIISIMSGFIIQLISLN